MPEPVRGTQPAVPDHVQVPASVAASMPASHAAPVSMAPVAMPAGAAAEPVARRAPELAAEEWTRYAPPPPIDSDQVRLATAAAAAAAPPSVGGYGSGGSPQHTVSGPANGDSAGGGAPPDESDSGNRNSMGFQITSIRQSSAEPDADPIDESGDEDVSDTAESSRTTADGAGLPAAAGDGGISTVDGLPSRLQLPLAGTPPPSTGLTPRELTASPGVASAEVLPVIPTIDGFGITLVTGALESVDVHGNAEIVEFPSEIEMDLMPTGLTVGVAPGSPGDDLQETWQSRFKVVKIETNVPFKRGRWQCMDYMDQPEAAGPAGADGTTSAGSSAHSSVQLAAGEPEPPPQPTASEEASLPGLAEDPAVRREPPSIDTATPDPAAAAGVTSPGTAAVQSSISVPHQAAVQAATAGRDAAAASSAPNVLTVTADRGVPLAVGGPAPSAPVLARQSSQPATPEEGRLASDGVPVLRPAATGGLTLPDLLPDLPNSSLLELVQASVADEQEGAADSTSPGSSGTVEKVEPIDNKIEQAMDLVKSHLLLAVREEVDVLKANISKLVDKISVLERENEVLKSNASPQVLAQLETVVGLEPSPAGPPASAAVTGPPTSAAVTGPPTSAAVTGPPASVGVTVPPASVAVTGPPASVAVTVPPALASVPVPVPPAVPGPAPTQQPPPSGAGPAP